jgi:hypothetical protein
MATTGISKSTATNSIKQVLNLAVMLESENGELAFHSCAPFRSLAAADAENNKNRVHQSLLFQRKTASFGDGRHWDCASHALSSLPLLFKRGFKSLRELPPKSLFAMAHREWQSMLGTTCPKSSLCSRPQQELVSHKGFELHVCVSWPKF